MGPGGVKELSQGYGQGMCGVTTDNKRQGSELSSQKQECVWGCGNVPPNSWGILRNCGLETLETNES